MKIEELMALEDALCDIISESFDKMPDAGTSRWECQKVDLISKVVGELSNITIYNGEENETD